MIIGIILGMLIGIIPALFGGALIADNCVFGEEWKGLIIGVIIEIIAIIIGGYIGIQGSKVEYDKKIANWNNTKMVLELAIRDETIGDLEKIDLVNKIVEYNMQLTELKEDVKQWWHWYLDDSKVNELELIDIRGE